MDKRNWKDLGILFVAILLIAASIGMALTRNISDESDDVVTFIQNSNGNYWTATGANFQLAIDDAGDYGWVSLPYCNITLTDTIFANYSGLEIYGHGNASKLFLEADANVSMITIYNADNVYLHDFMLDGNGLNQPEWWQFTGNKYDYAHGIELFNVDDSMIEDMVIHDVASTAIQWSDGERVRISDCLLTNSSRLYVESGNGYDHWFGKGIHFDNCPFSIIEGVIVDGACSTAIAVENEDQDNEGVWMQGVVVDNCRVRDSNVGFYVEWAKDCTFSDCYAEDCNRNDVYSDGCTGFLVASKTDRIYLDNCISIDNGKADSFSANFIINGQDTTLTDCHSYNSLYHGYVFSDDAINFNMDGCTSDNEAKIGIYSEAKTFSITDTNVNESGNQAMQLHNTQSITRGKVSDCSIRDASENAIQTAGGNLQITDNYIVDTTGRGVYVSTSSSLENIKIEGNIIDTPSNYGISLTTSSGTIENGSICDNTIIGGGYDAASMYIDDCLYFSIQDNTLITGSWDSNYYPQYGIREVGTSDYNIIKNNVLNGQFGNPITVIGENTIVSLNEGFDYDYYRDDLIWNSNGKYWTIDGTADDVQVQAAIDDIHDNSVNGKGTVLLPAGIINVTSDILPESDITIKGMGRDVTILRLADSSSTTRCIHMNNCYNSTICDLSIDGNNESVTDNYQLIAIEDSYYFDVHNVRLFNPYRAGLCFNPVNGAIGDCAYGKIYNLWVEGVDDYPNTQQSITGYHVNFTIFDNIHILGSGIKAENEEVWGIDLIETCWNDFSNIYIEGTGKGIKFFQTTSHNITIDTLDIRGLSDDDSDCCFWAHALTDSIITNFHFEPAYDGIITAGGSVRNQFITGTIIGGHTSLNLYGDHDVFKNLKLSNGNIGVYLYSCDDTVFDTIEVSDYVSVGFSMELCDRDMFTNLNVHDCSLGFYGKSNTRFSIINSFIYDNSGDGIDFVDATAVHNFTIKNCQFWGNAKAIDIASSSNYFIIDDNICYNDDIDINAATSGTRICPDTNIASIQTS